MSRYNSERKMLNNYEEFEELFERRNVNKIEHFRTRTLVYPNSREEDEVSFHRYVWKTQDKFYHISSAYYSDPTLWWVIAQYNNKPTEQHMVAGDILKIPYPLARILQIMGQ